MNYNLVIIAGKLNRPIELRYLNSGKSVGVLSISTTRSYTYNGESKTETATVDVEVFGKQAESLSEHLKEGQYVHVTGRCKSAG